MSTKDSVINLTGRPVCKKVLEIPIYSSLRAKILKLSFLHLCRGRHRGGRLFRRGERRRGVRVVRGGRAHRRVDILWGGNSIEKCLASDLACKKYLSFGLTFPSLRKSSKIGSLKCHRIKMESQAVFQAKTQAKTFLLNCHPDACSLSPLRS